MSQSTQNHLQYRQPEKKSKKIIISSQVAAVVTNFLTSPACVLKVRQQKALMDRSLQKNNCHKFNQKPISLTKTFNDIIKYEGYQTFFNGLKYNLIRSMGSNMIQLVTYEKVKCEIAKRTNNFYMIPLIASSTSSLISTTLTFPLEYWKTIQQSQVGQTKLQGFQLGSKIFSAYFVTIQRNMLYFCVYWTVSERARKSLGYYEKDSHKKSFQDTFMINSFSGLLGACAALCTSPFDTVKTRKQLNPIKYKNQGSLRMMANIIKHEGGAGKLFAGVKPSFIGACLYGVSNLAVYEGVYKMLDKFDQTKH